MSNLNKRFPLKRTQMESQESAGFQYDYESGDVSDFAVNFGAKVRAERKRRGLRTHELARQLGLSPSYTALLERGTRMPSMKIFLRVCETFDLTPNDMIVPYDGKMPQTRQDAKYTRIEAATDVLKMFSEHQLEAVMALLRSARSLCDR